MERKQTAPEFITEEVWRGNIAESKQRLRAEQRNLSFNEKMQIAFGLNERDEQIKRVRKK